MPSCLLSLYVGWHKSKEQVREPNDEEEESESSNDESNDVKVLDTSYMWVLLHQVRSELKVEALIKWQLQNCRACGVGATNDGNVSHFFGDMTCHMASLDDFWIV